MKKKKWHLQALRRHDNLKDDCVVRELEMAVDGAIYPGPDQVGHIMQFWQDVRLYGVDEAILYVANGNYGNHFVILETWQKILPRLG